MLALLLVASVVVWLPVQADAEPASDPWGSDPSQTLRLGSGNPTRTAIDVSRARFSGDDADHVVVSRFDVFADALAGSGLLADGPLLLTRPDALDDMVRAEIERVLPEGGRVYLLGGEQALSSSIESVLESDGYEVVRIAGANRYETAALVAQEVARLHPANADMVLVARGYGTPDNPTAAWADSVSVAGWAAATGTPLVLTDSDSLRPEAADFIGRRMTAYLLGGTAALSERVAEEVRETGAGAERVAGTGRAETAAVIATDLWGASAGQGRYAVINGWDEDAWGIGLAAGGLSADFEAPMLLTLSSSVPAGTANMLRGRDDSVRTLGVGSQSYIADGTLERIEALDGEGPSPSPSPSPSPTPTASPSPSPSPSTSPTPSESPPSAPEPSADVDCSASPTDFGYQVDCYAAIQGADASYAEWNCWVSSDEYSARAWCHREPTRESEPWYDWTCSTLGRVYCQADWDGDGEDEVFWDCSASASDLACTGDVAPEYGADEYWYCSTSGSTTSCEGNPEGGAHGGHQSWSCSVLASYAGSPRRWTCSGQLALAIRAAEPLTYQLVAELRP